MLGFGGSNTTCKTVAEGGGVEPPRPFQAQLFSRQVPSPIGLPLRCCGADGGNRTHDLFITNEVRLPLCYISILLVMAESKGFEPLCALQRPVISNHGQ